MKISWVFLFKEIFICVLNSYKYNAWIGTIHIIDFSWSQGSLRYNQYFKIYVMSMEIIIVWLYINVYIYDGRKKYNGFKIKKNGASFPMIC